SRPADATARRTPRRTRCSITVMRAGAFKADVRVFFGERVNQHPIRLDMAVPAARKVSAQRVILEFRRQRLTVNQPFKRGLELHHVFAPLFSAFDIFLELAGAAEGSHRPRSAKSSFLLPNRFTFRPALLAWSVRAVRAFGIRTSKGKPRCSLICR